MSALLEQLHTITETKITIPAEISALYHWIEQNGLIEKYDSGFLGGRISEEWDNVPDVTFTASYHDALRYWFDVPAVTEEIAARLVIFASSGADGSMLGMWLDDDRQVRFVHLGSGSGSQLCCIVARNARDFLSLLAVGYNELGMVYDFSLSPEEVHEGGELNASFLEWLKETFNITRPENAAQIVGETPEIWCETTSDPFCLWCNKQFGS
ncbi:hypothetical protein EDF81_0592 [Enterobacter sp. BIGb0383]|uniref:hypothetical protein n=1 Tax=unclassified Enterobacter TaxID=2608935 RepID=UPI000F4950BC|nr:MULTISPECIES: hypothetical protein [unclassified Enterobacter]ROP62110.1 hypothetical protein EDF81_0592 [Enterobacter sp. BIGb0383]ROS12272.1 hypothetical protein EC848_0594 [Enterobacter sp. BIGb0359]